MQSKILSKRIRLILGLTGLVLCSVLLFNFIQKSPIWSGRAIIIENIAVFPTPEQVSVGLPLRLKIPKIGVDSSVEYVGLNPDGAMDIPKNPDNVAWFELGQSPGENGSAVVAGHYGWKGGKPSVFDNLHKLRKGDMIFIEDDKGVSTPFVVRESRRYDPQADASGVFSSTDGKSHLNLVTCEGEWDKTTEQYSKRLVVFTDKE